MSNKKNCHQIYLCWPPFFPSMHALALYICVAIFGYIPEWIVLASPIRYRCCLSIHICSMLQHDFVLSRSCPSHHFDSLWKNQLDYSCAQHSRVECEFFGFTVLFCFSLGYLWVRSHCVRSLCFFRNNTCSAPKTAHNFLTRPTIWWNLKITNSREKIIMISTAWCKSEINQEWRASFVVIQSK